MKSFFFSSSSRRDRVDQADQADRAARAAQGRRAEPSSIGLIMKASTPSASSPHATSVIVWDRLPSHACRTDRRAGLPGPG